MRISNNMTIYKFLTSLNKSQTNMVKFEEQLSDGKIVHRPSDDPIRAVKGLRLDIDLAMNVQYTQNNEDAQAWLNQTDNSMQSLSSLMIEAKGLMVQAANSYLTPTDEIALGAKLSGIIDQMIMVGNSQSGERYIFAGQQDFVLGGPFEKKTLQIDDGTGAVPPNFVSKDFVVYKGDLNKISMTIQPGAPTPRQDSVNLTGEDLFGRMGTVFDAAGKPYQVVESLTNFLRIQEAMSNGDPSIKDQAIQSNSTLLNTGTAKITGPFTPGNAMDFQVTMSNVDAAGHCSQITVNYTDDLGAAQSLTINEDPPQSGVFALPYSYSVKINDGKDNLAGDIYNFRVPDNLISAESGIQFVDDLHTRVLKANTLNGARQATYEMAHTMMKKSNVTIQENISLNGDLDIPRALIDYKNNENVYKAALSVGASIMPVSLVDFLR